jgi:hypothetical protein
LMDAILSAMQWPAMGITLLAAWLVASQSKRKRSIGFWLFIASNVLWIAWGVHAHAYALIVLQICLASMNIRGARKTETPGPQRGGPDTLAR